MNDQFWGIIYVFIWFILPVSPVAKMCCKVQHFPCLIQRFAEVCWSQQLQSHVEELMGHIISAVHVKLNDFLRCLINRNIKDVHSIIKDQENKVSHINE